MASNRRRLGVALLLDGPVGAEVDGLRRALADPSFGRIPAHLTLVPPVNVRNDDLGSALAVLRTAAAAQPGPMKLHLGAVSTFMPQNPVAYLSVGGELEALRRLRDGVFKPPLERKLSWPWIPHVTLADGINADQIRAALEALSGYAVAATFDRVVLLEEGPGRAWTPLADADLGHPAKVGTGGLTIELTTGRIPDPELAGAPIPGLDGLDPPVVVTARREGKPVGGAAAWLDRAGGHVAVMVLAEHRRQGIGSQLLAWTRATVRRRGWVLPLTPVLGPEGFYAAKGLLEGH